MSTLQILCRDEVFYIENSTEGKYRDYRQTKCFTSKISLESAC